MPVIQTKPVICACMKAKPSSEQNSIMEFETLCKQCPALRELLVPRDIVSEYIKFCESDRDEAHHEPILYLAFQRGAISHYTYLAHSLFFDQNDKLHSITTQYKKDLTEKWITETDYKNRFRKSRLCKSRWAELFFAEWLEHHCWTIEELEATGGSSDVKARCADGALTHFEVKNIGISEYNFDQIVRSFQSQEGVSVSSYDIYSPIDYLICRIYDGAKQIERIDGKKIVVAILEDYQFYYAISLGENWINWNLPKLFRKSEGIQRFLKETYKYDKEETFDKVIIDTIRNIDEIWIYEIDNYLLHRRHIFSTHRVGTDLTVPR